MFAFRPNIYAYYNVSVFRKINSLTGELSTVNGANTGCFYSP